MAWKIPWYSIGRFALIILCLAIVLALVVVILPIYLDITAFKGPIEESLTTLVKAPVTIEEIRLHPSLWPTLTLSGFEVAGSRSPESPAFAYAESVEIKLAVLPLLKKQIRLMRFAASGVTVHAHRQEGEAGNWPVSTTSEFELSELAGIELEDVNLYLEDHDTVRATMIVDHLTCDIAKNRPLDLQLQGSLQGLPLSVSAAGPTLATPLSQASDFPLSVGLQWADLRLDLEGAASREPGGTKFHFAFDIDSEELSWIRELGEIDLPQIGGLQLSGQLSNRQATLEVSEMTGSVGSTSVHGRLALSLAAGKPEVSGRLSLGQLDLAPWLEPSSDSDSDSSKPLTFSLLSAVNADLKLTLKELTGLEIAMDDIDLEIEIANGVMSIPATLRAAAIPLSAQLEVNSDREVPRVASRVWARDLTLGELDGLVDIPDNLDGRFGALDLQMTSTGHSIDAISANLLIEAEAQDARLFMTDQPDRQPIEVYLSQARATHRPGQPLVVTAAGELFDETFSIDLETAALANLVGNDHWPLSVSFQGAGASIDLEGTLETETSGLGVDIVFDASGDRLGDLSNWLGLSAQNELTYSLQGRLTSSAGISWLRLGESTVGKSRFSGEFSWSAEDETEPFMIDLHATILDLRELKDPSHAITRLDTEQEVLRVDIPILPSRVQLHDAEIDLAVDRIPRDTVDLTDVKATFHIQQAHLVPSPFSFTHDTQTFDGEINLDLRGEIPHFTLELRGGGENLGQILAQERLAEGITVAAESMDLRIDAYGASIREIVRSANLSGHLVNFHWQIHPPELEEPLTVQFEHFDLSGPRGQPIELGGTGRLQNEALDLHLTLRVPEDPASAPEQSVPFHLAIGLADTSIDLDGEARLPITKGEFELQTVVEGESLASLSSLVRRDLPSLGPFRLEGNLLLDESDRSLRDLRLRLGESDFSGEISYYRIEGRPMFKADLTSQLLRVEDIFDLEAADPGEDGTKGLEDDLQTLEIPEKPGLTLEQLNEFDVELDLVAQQIVTAGGEMADMTIDADLHRGSLDLLVRRDQHTEKDAELTARVRPWGQGIETQLRASWDRQPYGFLASILNPGASGGSWSVDLDLDSRGSDFPELLANLSGHINYANYPQDVNATIFDLWGGGLINSLLPVFQLGAESRVNCSVAKLQVDQGVLTPESLIIDTTRTRVRGKGTIDLPNDKIRLTLKPRPKKRNLINLSMPVKIRGPLTSPDVDISKGGLAVTFFRLSLWVYTVWRDLIRRPLPADGSDICVDPFAAPRKK